MKGKVMSTVVAFGHRSRVGKDTCVKYLSTILSTQGYKVQHIAFATALKDTCFQLYGWAGLKRAIHYENHPEDRQVILPLIGKTPVQIWVEVGNALRGVYENTWVDLALKTQYKSDFILFSDLRYPNEIVAVEAAGGYHFKVNNSRATVLDTVADNALQGYADWFGYIMNEGTLHDLNVSIEKLAADLIAKRLQKSCVYGEAVI